MSRNGSGTYTLPAGQPVVTGTTISSTTFNTLTSDLATALTQSLASDGQTTPTANLPMGGFKLTGLGAGSAATDSVRLSQVQSAVSQLISTIAGVDTITGVGTPTLTAYATGQSFRFVSAGANTGAATLNIDSLGAKAITKNGTTALVAGDIPSGALVTVSYDGTQFQLSGLLPIASVTYDNAICDFRATLTTGVPITITDVTGATTIYACPLRGNRIALYDGSGTWNVRTSAQFSIALGTLTSGLPYDLFIYDNAGTPAFRSPVAWSNGTTRATALTTQDGVLVKTGATTDRYFATFYTTSTTQTEDSASKRFLFNYYNQVDRIQSVVDTTDSWSYTTATWRQARASSANKFSSVIGVAETMVEIDVHGSFTNAGGSGAVGVGVGVDSTTVNSATTFGGNQQLSNASNNIDAKYRGYPAVGYHDFNWLEISFVGGTTTFYGDSGTTLMQTGMMGKFRG